jgi:acyl-coenzyme A synthetase/AMP-(fatty) acid ligase
MEFTNRSRCLTNLPFTLNGSYLFAVACVRAGGTVISEKRLSVMQAISAHAITHVMLLPIHLRALLDGLPECFEKPTELLVLSLGAPLSEALRAKAMARLASRVCDLFGIQEAGNIAWIVSGGRGGVATLWPDVQAQIVDAAGVPLSSGQPGRLGVRTPHMSEHYLDDPDATARMFRDGWFYPGDVAILRDGRRLEIIGRGDDLLNVGGTKVPPAELEELVLRTIDAKDTGVCSARRRRHQGDLDCRGGLPDR